MRDELVQTAVLREGEQAPFSLHTDTHKSTHSHTQPPASYHVHGGEALLGDGEGPAKVLGIRVGKQGDGARRVLQVHLGPAQSGVEDVVGTGLELLVGGGDDVLLVQKIMERPDVLARLGIVQLLDDPVLHGHAAADGLEQLCGVVPLP
jgi:hypothetical protein